jgi:hypothetical protein
MRRRKGAPTPAAAAAPAGAGPERWRHKGALRRDVLARDGKGVGAERLVARGASWHVPCHRLGARRGVEPIAGRRLRRVPRRRRLQLGEAAGAAARMAAAEAAGGRRIGRPRRPRGVSVAAHM